MTARGAVAASGAARLVGGGLLRADERTLLVSAGGVFALASAGAAMSAAAADAMFLSELGPGHLGEAVAASSALLAVVLAVVGGLADRLERRRVLATLAMVSGLVIAGLAALSVVAPVPAAIGALVGGKQLAAATDLAFWVVIAERLDARRSQRLLPILAASGGAGATLGAVLVVPLAAVGGARGVLLCGALLLVLAALAAQRLPQTRRVSAQPVRVGGLIMRSWRDGARAVRRHPLARHLAIVVACAGVFGSLAYFALGVEVAAKGGSAGELAVVLGAVRGVGQFVTLFVQVVLASRIIRGMGTGNALLLAPLVALSAGLGLVIAPVLAVAIATQVSARVLDSGIETPAEKLAQTLLPTAVRGRISGFLDGTAKRAGAMLGGLIAAAFATTPSMFYAITAIAAAIWLLAAARTARALPSLAVEHVQKAGDADAAVDDRALTVLYKELAGPKPERAAEVLARLHERGRIDAVGPLVNSAVHNNRLVVWRAVIAVLDAPAEAHGPKLAEAVVAAGRARELAVRALGLAGGVPAATIDDWKADRDPAIALTAEVAALRLANDRDALLALLGDSVRDAGVTARVAIEELGVEIARGLARRDDAHTLEAARHLTRALRRKRGDTPARTQAYAALARVVDWARDRRDAELSLLRSDLLELARERVETGATPIAPDHMLSSLMRAPDSAGDEAPEIAAALRLYGELLDGADTVEPDDLRRLARALGEADDDVRAAAETALTALGPAAAGELISTAAWGRRRARDRAAALLHELPVTAGAIDRLIDAELDSLDTTHAAIAVLDQPGDELLARRLDERLHEIAHTVLLLVAARGRSRAIARAAVGWRHARGGQERARTLAVIQAALPRALVTRLVEAVDDLSVADRATELDRAGITPPPRDEVIRTELAGRDRLARGIVLHMLTAAGRSAHRETITDAARAEALSISPTELLRRVTDAIYVPAEEPARPEEGEPDMPSRVETLIALGRVPLLASLSTRQLADVAERARWVHAREGSVVITSGDPLDALIVVEDGELELGPRKIVKGEVVDELACVAPVPVSADLRAVRASRLIRLERIDFEELVDDVPGLASAVCRGLGERARRGEDTGYRSPLISKS
ncbi:MAG: MFS transporter [Deltaproteobacteria bacterium]|nr:MFS transporter [Deltaproteobacteria bacterium]